MAISQERIVALKKFQENVVTMVFGALFLDHKAVFQSRLHALEVQTR